MCSICTANSVVDPAIGGDHFDETIESGLVETAIVQPRLFHEQRVALGIGPKGSADLCLHVLRLPCP